MKNIFKIIVLLLGISLLHTSCDKLFPNFCTQGYNFHIPYSLTPGDTFKVGDTLWVESEFSSFMKDTVSGNVFEVKDLDFKMFMTIYDLKSNPMRGTSHYYLLNSDGAFDSTRNGKMKYAYANNTYSYKKGIVFTRKGWYLLGVSDFLIRSLSEQNRNIGNCKGELVDLSYYNIHGIYNHYLLEEAAEERAKSFSSTSIVSVYIED